MIGQARVDNVRDTKGVLQVFIMAEERQLMGADGVTMLVLETSRRGPGWRSQLTTHAPD